jgi:hypothetical protein
MNFNSIRDRVPITAHEQAQDTDDDPEDDDGLTQEQLVQADRSLRDRLTPNSNWGWIALFGAALLTTTLLLWIAPLIPPWATSLPAVLVYVNIVSIGGVWLKTRRSMLEYWNQFDLFVEKNGTTARAILGKIDGSTGGDKLFKQLHSVGTFGFSPTYESVDDVFGTERPLKNKISRRDTDGEWDAARTRLDHAYEAEDTTADGLFGNTVVVATSGVKTVKDARKHDKKTLPPNTVDTESVKRIVSRDQTLREDVIPSYEERLQTRNARLDKVVQDALDQPIYTQSEVMDLLEQMQQASRRNDDQRVAPEPAPATQEVDEKVEEDMEDYNE